MIRHAVDTGPLVALLNARDEHHVWARDAFDGVAPPLLTCEAVLSEACHLLREVRGGPKAVLELVARGAVAPVFRLDAEARAVDRLMTRYASVPMSLADACLVRMTELDDDLRIVTLDRDFRVYRRHGRQAVPILMP
jgi:uncharacterized protein